MNKGEEDRKDKNVRNGRKTGLALEKIPIIGLILLILLFLFLAILNYILDLHFTLPDFWLITAPGIIKMLFYSFMSLYILSLSIFSFWKGLLFCQDLTKLSLVKPSLQTYLTLKYTKLLDPPCPHNI